MTYASLMVHLDLHSPNDSRLRIAGDLAEKTNARVIGIAAGDFAPPYFADGVYAQRFIEEQRDKLGQRMAELEKVFRAALKGRVRGVEWRSEVTFPDDYVSRHARAADLIIVGSNSQGRMVDPACELSTSNLVMHAGRPLLVVPPEAEWLRMGSVLVGWKDTREARRAVSDAVPLLKLAREVTLVEIVERDKDRAAARTRLDDVKAWLGGHGIYAAVMTALAHSDHDQLRALATERGADLIVAGAYGHRRFREWIFGGVTLDLLTRSRQCVLLAH